MLLALFQSGPWPGFHADPESGLGHLGHIEGIFQDLFTYKKYRKKFPENG